MIKAEFNIPVVLIVYRRPDTTKQVLNSLSVLKPVNLWVIADGARKNRSAENDLVAETRSLINGIGWDCDIHKNYSNTNLGLRRRIVSGLNWVYKHENQAIILEDDCVPDQSFYLFCAELLERFRDDQRIMAISGNNFLRGRKRTPYSYYYSRYPHCWGWATWKRAWNKYDDKMDLWPEISNGEWLHDILNHDQRAYRYWRKIFTDVYNEKIDSWAYRWTLSCWVNSGLTILPNTNLVSNIGFQKGATHTVSYRNVKPSPIHPVQFPLYHPPYIIRDQEADDFSQKTHFGSGYIKSIKRKIVWFLKKTGILKIIYRR